MTSGELYPYQREGVDFLKERRRAYLADEMGLGKTVQALVAAHELGLASVMVVCPASVTGNWEREAETWAPGVTVRAVSYTSFAMGKRPLSKPDVLILDEAHYVKNPKAKRTKAVVNFIRHHTGEGLHVWMLSGTPMPNDPRELYVPARILNPAATKGFTAWKWRNTFCQIIPGHFGPKVVGVRNAGRLRDIFQHSFKGRRLSDVALELPPLRITTQSLDLDGDLPEEIQELYEAMEAEEADTEGVSRLRRLLGELKAPLVAAQLREEWLDRLWDHIVVMAHHRAVLDTLEQEFDSRDIRTVRVDGSTPQSKRQERVELFQAGDVPVFLGQQTAAGIGLTLTQASELVLVEPSWSPSDNDQAIKRIHRISQDAPCRARIFTIRGTLDEAVMGVITRKTRMIQEVGL